MCMVRTLRCNIYVIFVHSEVHRNALFVLLNSHKDRIFCGKYLWRFMFYAKYSSS